MEQTALNKAKGNNGKGDSLDNDGSDDDGGDNMKQLRAERRGALHPTGPLEGHKSSDPSLGNDNGHAMPQVTAGPGVDDP